MSDVLIKAALARLSWRSQWGGCTQCSCLETGMDVEQCSWKFLVVQREGILPQRWGAPSSPRAARTGAWVSCNQCCWGCARIGFANSFSRPVLKAPRQSWDVSANPRFMFSFALPVHPASFHHLRDSEVVVSSHMKAALRSEAAPDI